MCEPATLTTLALVSAGLSAAGTGYAALSANAQAVGAARVADANAKQASLAAQDALARGNQDQIKHYREVSQRIGAQRATMAANGLDLSFGSAADLVGDTALFGQEDALTLANNSNAETMNIASQGANFRNEAASDRAKGQSALIGGVFNVGSTLIGGASQYATLKRKASGGALAGAFA